MSVKERNGRAKRAYLKGLTARLEDKGRKINPYKFSEWGTGFAWLKGWNAADSAIKHDHLIPLLERAIELLADTAEYDRLSAGLGRGFSDPWGTSFTVTRKAL